MSDRELNQEPENVQGEVNEVEVGELDEKSLEEASGGAGSADEFVDDVNGFMCNC